MVRRSIEWVLGSVLVYVSVAACAASGGVEGLVEKATGGLKNMIEGTGAIAGALGSGASNQAPNGGKAETGSGATRGEGANQGSGATQGDGASGGMSIMDPVPEADAAEDGTRIVNLYRTTADGLKTAEGYWDRELELKCQFYTAEDGKERCLPPLSASVGTYFTDSACSSSPAALAVKGVCPEYGYQGMTSETCGGAASYRYAIYKLGAKANLAYQKSGDKCVEVSASTLETFDIYPATKLTPSMFAEGALVSGRAAKCRGQGQGDGPSMFAEGALVSGAN